MDNSDLVLMILGTVLLYFVLVAVIEAYFSIREKYITRLVSKFKGTSNGKD